MIISTFGDKYHKFLGEMVKPYNYIRGQDGFNMGMIRIGENKYLFCVRVLGVIPAYFGEPIVPGNYSGSEKYIREKLGKNVANKISFGKNFFWGEWNKSLIDNTIFFVGYLDSKTLNFEIDTKIKPYAIMNYPIKDLKYFYSDVRLFQFRDKIFCYDGYISGIYQITIENSQITGAFPLLEGMTKLTFYVDVCKNIKEFDKNWAYLTSNIYDGVPYTVFLNWFEKGTVTMSYLPKKAKIKDCLKKVAIVMKGDKIEGLGTDTFPMFSFGTPMFEVIKDKLWIGSGHIKILTSLQYKNPEIAKFQTEVSKLKQKYNYISHLSYYYLTYHIVVMKDNDKWSMFISDGYLYIPIKKQYVFSINFPMGIDVNNDNVIISMGFGDYYTGVVGYGLREFIKMCGHSVEHFEIPKYKFHIAEN